MDGSGSLLVSVQKNKILGSLYSAQNYQTDTTYPVPGREVLDDLVASFSTTKALLSLY